MGKGVLTLDITSDKIRLQIDKLYNSGGFKYYGKN